jgi:hypothetical protein
MIALILLAQIAATPAPPSTPTSAQPTPTPVKVVPDHPRTLADVARERKLGIKGAKGGRFSAAQSTVAPSASTMTEQERQIQTYGEPKKRNVTTFEVNGKVHTSEQWIYDFGYIYFKDGHMTAVQGSY